MVPSGIEPLIPALLAPCLNQLGQGTRKFTGLMQHQILIKVKQNMELNKEG